MKKLYVTLAILFATLLGLAPCTFANEEQADAAATPVVNEVKSIEVLPTMNWKSDATNRIWVGTFQIVWNEFMDNLVYGPVKFVDYNSPMAKALNKQSFKKSYIGLNSYYTKYGMMTPSLKEEIEKGIQEKFNETSDILDTMEWAENSDNLLVYAMLKKDFKFLNAFDKLSTGGFGKNYNAFPYFGINENSDKKLYKNLKVLFYNSNEDFAVKLFTKDRDEVILYRTNNDTTFDEYYSELNKKSRKFRGNKRFAKHDELRIPNINLYQQASFKELEGHDVKGTNFRIDSTIETIDFKMNNEGVELKSEAAMIAKMSALLPERGRKFYFTDNFVLFLIEKGQKTPYYAMKVSDLEALNSTAKEEE